MKGIYVASKQGHFQLGKNFIKFFKMMLFTLTIYVTFAMFIINYKIKL
jgi:hypothetical protein